ncbi:phosphate ABC transporter substrate-binding protein PstS [Streptomyces sp. NPDC057617]|uniref:phosphate ABC transporter substrate-binding protein PstS n=1 Tax=Streptomyces sp. NPDC057617 TaxID=3346184 RepID=UPI0036A15230
MSGTHPAPLPGRPIRAALAAVALATLVLLGLVRPVPATAATYVPISGTGSTWSKNALDQWVANVRQYGMSVTYNGTGSSDGRTQFRNGVADYAVSEIPYGIKDSGVVDSPPSRKYAYMPIVAGGTSFMYNLKIGNQRVTNLRLSGEALARIFTGEIKFWNDPAIKADNPSLASSLPARKVVPVVRSDGSGTTAQLTTWMAKQYPSIWNGYCAKAGRGTPCGTTSNYPLVPGSGFVAQSGSNGVSGYVAEKGNIGTITYVEYSYAVQTTHFPVVKVLNAAGYYTEPTARNVAVALLNARINNNTSSPEYLTQILDGVYNGKDRRNYPLSSYSYMIIPTKVEGKFNPNKGKTLGAFAYYFLCQGQQNVDELGFSPLPVNLVQAGLTQVRKIPGVNVENINIKNCHNPTFSADGSNTLAKSAPYPPACDRKGATQCSTGTGGDRTPTVPRGGGGGGSASGGGSGGSTGGGGDTGGSGGTATGGGGTGGSGAQGAGATGGATGGATTAGAATGGGAGTAIDPDTGQPIAAGAQTGGTGDVAGAGGGGGGEAFAVPVSTSGTLGGNLRLVLMVLAALLLVVVTVGPPLLSRYLTVRKRTS